MASNELIPVKLTNVFEDDEIASVYIEGDAATIGVNLWQVEGFSRKFDGIQMWKYRPVAEFDSFEAPADLNFAPGTMFAALNVGSKTYGGYFIDTDGTLRAFLGNANSRRPIDLTTVRHIVTPRANGTSRKDLFERLYKTLTDASLKPKARPVEFIQERKIEALPLAAADTDVIEDFLADTEFTFTAHENPNSFIGIMHQSNLGPASYGRRFLARDHYIVKVNGKIAAVTKLDGLKKDFDYAV